MKAVCRTISGSEITATGDVVEMLHKFLTANQPRLGCIQVKPNLGWITIDDTAINFQNVETIVFSKEDND
ncbi:hypothetical protein 000TH008_142 [Bacillus phage 000TH008]|nr:hypothetical protein 000TH008_142 [Bacillus phage 000TH008]QQO40836.1 hypothetical protein 000TH009_142 [Bacillus phage 000TH009]